MEPPLKKQRVAYEESPSLLGCPRDVLRIIVNFVTDIESVLNLASVCKKMNARDCLALMHNCSLTTDIPLSTQMSRKIAQSTSLQSLMLHFPYGDNMTEALLQLTSLSNIQCLKLRVYGFKIDSVEELFSSLSNITHLELMYMDPIPKSCQIFNSLTNLRRLVLFDSIKHLGALTTLQNLDQLLLRSNMMKSEQFEYLNYLSKLTFLECSDNGRMLEPSFKYMSMMTALQVFKMSQDTDVWGAYYTSDSLEYICNSMTNLTKLIWDWNFNGPLPENFTNLRKLKVFKINTWDAMDRDMKKLLYLTNLKKLTISVTKSSAHNVLSLTNLQSLSLYGEADYSKEFLMSMLTRLTYLHFCIERVA